MNAPHHHPAHKPPALSTETPPPNTKTGVDQHKRTRAGTNKTLVSGGRVGLLSFGGGCALGGSVSNMYGVWFLLWTAGRVCVRFVWLCCEVLLCLVMVVFVRWGGVRCVCCVGFRCGGLGRVGFVRCVGSLMVVRRVVCPLVPSRALRLL